MFEIQLKEANRRNLRENCHFDWVLNGTSSFENLFRPAFDRYRSILGKSFEIEPTCGRLDQIEMVLSKWLNQLRWKARLQVSKNYQNDQNMANRENQMAALQKKEAILNITKGFRVKIRLEL